MSSPVFNAFLHSNVDLGYAQFYCKSSRAGRIRSLPFETMVTPPKLKRNKDVSVFGGLLQVVLA
jgi:hypothetical protein